MRRTLNQVLGEAGDVVLMALYTVAALLVLSFALVVGGLARITRPDLFEGDAGADR